MPDPATPPAPEPQPAPCPWCGHPVRVRRAIAWRVSCYNGACHARGPRRGTPTAAVAAWDSVAGRPAWVWNDADGRPVNVGDWVELLANPGAPLVIRCLRTGPGTPTVVMSETADGPLGIGDGDPRLAVTWAPSLIRRLPAEPERPDKDEIGDGWLLSDGHRAGHA